MSPRPLTPPSRPPSPAAGGSFYSAAARLSPSPATNATAAAGIAAGPAAALRRVLRGADGDGGWVEVAVAVDLAGGGGGDGGGGGGGGGGREEGGGRRVLLVPVDRGDAGLCGGDEGCVTMRVGDVPCDVEGRGVRTP